MRFPALPIGAFIAAVLVLLPSPAHWRARNVATLSLIIWLFTLDIIYAVNSLVWAGTTLPRIPVWCDITTKLIIGSNTALPAATMCICKHLEMVASGRVVRLTSDDKRRRMIFDALMCFGVPIIFMTLHYIVQGHRFDIVEDLGCQPAVYNSIPAIFLLWFPSLALSTATLVYATLALRHFLRKRITFSAHLQGADAALTAHRYARLMTLALVEMCWGSALTAFTLRDNVVEGLRPWTTWADVHSDFGRIAQFPTTGVPTASLAQLLVLWCAVPVSSFIFFLFFGIGEEALKDYRRVLRWIRRHVLRQSPPDAKLLTSTYDFSHRRVDTRSLVTGTGTHGSKDTEDLPAYRSSVDRLPLHEKLGYVDVTSPFDERPPLSPSGESTVSIAGSSTSCTALSDEDFVPYPWHPVPSLHDASSQRSSDGVDTGRSSESSARAPNRAGHVHTDAV